MTIEEITMENREIKHEETKKEFQSWLKRHWNPALNSPKGQREWDSVTRSVKAKKQAGEPLYKYEDVVQYNGEEWIVQASWVREDIGENEYKLTNMDGTETIYAIQSKLNPVNESMDVHPELTCDRCGFTSSQEDYFDIIGDEILCGRCRRKLIKEKGKKFCYMMSASGYGTRKYCFDTEEECREEMRKDAEATAAECDGEVQPYDDDELVVCSEYDGEVARFEYIG